MKINYQEKPYSDETQAFSQAITDGHPYHCFVDGKEIALVWYADTEAGIVKTYDVLRDGKVYMTSDIKALAALDIRVKRFHGKIELPEGGIMSETLRGKVELKQV